MAICFPALGAVVTSDLGVNGRAMLAFLLLLLLYSSAALYTGYAFPAYRPSEHRLFVASVVVYPLTLVIATLAVFLPEGDSPDWRTLLRRHASPVTSETPPAPRDRPAETPATKPTRENTDSRHDGTLEYVRGKVREAVAALTVPGDGQLQQRVAVAMRILSLAQFTQSDFAERPWAWTTYTALCEMATSRPDDHQGSIAATAESMSDPQAWATATLLRRLSEEVTMEPGRPLFELDTRALSHVTDLLYGTLRPIEFPESFTGPILERAEREEGAGIGRAYLTAFMDLHRLLEEIRFETAFAYLLVDDFRLKVALGEAEDHPKSEVTLPAEVSAVLMSYMREPPHPAKLFDSPHIRLTGNRVLSEWFAAQLLDSVLVRCVAACDRLATILWTHADIPFRRRKDVVRFPSFTPGDLRTLANHYGEQPAWSALRALADDPVFEGTKAIRNEFTHSRRLVSELHGEDYLAYVDGEGLAAASANDRLALPHAFYHRVITEAVRLTGELLEESGKRQASVDHSKGPDRSGPTG